MVADPGIDIARATTSDATAILALQRLAYRGEAELYDDRSIPPLTQTPSELIDEFQTMVFLKASDSGTVVGSVRAKRSGIGRETSCSRARAANETFDCMHRSAIARSGPGSSRRI